MGSTARRGRGRAGVAVAVPLAGLLVGCGDGALDPGGEEAATIAGIWWVLLALGTLVFVGVIALLVVALRRGGAPAGEPSADDEPGTGFVVWGGIAMPAVVLLVVVVVATWAARDLRQPADDDVLRVEVTAHQFWWDVRYPDHDVRTANRVHIPVGEPVELVLRSGDVIHSFWVPRLAGKLDLVPGHTNELVVEAREAGELDGYCAELCGIQHTNMRIDVVAQERPDFDAWLEQRSGPAPEPADERAAEGLEVLLAAGCARCHRVAGTDAAGEVGPDLTDVASRPELAGGALDATRGDLAGWVLDPQHAKPGSLMPPTALEPDELLALLAYLETLR